MKALVSPQKKAEWKINKQEFISELQEKYNVIELNEITDIKRGLMVKCTPERGQKCSLFHLMVKCTPIIVELPSVYRGCKPLICFQ